MKRMVLVHQMTKCQLFFHHGMERSFQYRVNFVKVKISDWWWCSMEFSGLRILPGIRPSYPASIYMQPLGPQSHQWKHILVLHLARKSTAYGGNGESLEVALSCGFPFTLSFRGSLPEGQGAERSLETRKFRSNCFVCLFQRHWGKKSKLNI